MKDRISVVMCVKNGEKTIERALESVRKNRPYEIVVVDGNSEDGTLQIARRYTAQIYSDEGRGLAYARQLGAEKARGEYVAFIDSDTELPDEELLSRMLEELKENRWVAIHAQLLDPRDNKTYWERVENFHWITRHNRVGERKHMATMLCLIRRDIILLYQFDSFFRGAAEDGDFYHRIAAEGHKFGVSRRLAYHYHRASFKQFVKQRIWYGKGNARTMVKRKSISFIFTPLAIALYGIWLCASNKKLTFIPFYLLWTTALFVGTMIGLVELVFQR